MTCMTSVHIQQAAHAHLAVHDLQDDVTNDMRGILKSEEKWNVLEREEKMIILMVSVNGRQATLQLYLLHKVTSYLRVYDSASKVGRSPTMCDKALEPAYMFPTNRREPGSQDRAADL